MKKTHFRKSWVVFFAFALCFRISAQEHLSSSKDNHSVPNWLVGTHFTAGIFGSVDNYEIKYDYSASSGFAAVQHKGVFDLSTVNFMLGFGKESESETVLRDTSILFSKKTSTDGSAKSFSNGTKTHDFTTAEEISDFDVRFSSKAAWRIKRSPVFLGIYGNLHYFTAQSRFITDRYLNSSNQWTRTVTALTDTTFLPKVGMDFVLATPKKRFRLEIIPNFAPVSVQTVSYGKSPSLNVAFFSHFGTDVEVSFAPIAHFRITAFYNFDYCDGKFKTSEIDSRYLEGTSKVFYHNFGGKVKVIL